MFLVNIFISTTQTFNFLIFIFHLNEILIHNLISKLIDFVN